MWPMWPKAITCMRPKAVMWPKAIMRRHKPWLHLPPSNVLVVGERPLGCTRNAAPASGPKRSFSILRSLSAVTRQDDNHEDELEPESTDELVPISSREDAQSQPWPRSVSSSPITRPQTGAPTRPWVGVLWLASGARAAWLLMAPVPSRMPRC